MIIGIPKGLLYCNYSEFFKSFFRELGAEVVVSEDTNKKILNDGVKYCIDDACLPVKIFHGHVVSLIDRVDMIFIPRIMQLEKREFICPKFCGLPEMISNSIPNLPNLIQEPIYARSKKDLYRWGLNAGRHLTKDKNRIKRAVDLGIERQRKSKTRFKGETFDNYIALVGHPYNIYDEFGNMNIVSKLNEFGIGVITEETTDQETINRESKKLYKRPFWTFAKNSYGFALDSMRNGDIRGIIYISSFACGIDSVIIELIEDKIGDFPMMTLKLDEHTGEAGINTRIEAFIDMLERSF